MTTAKEGLPDINENSKQQDFTVFNNDSVFS